MINKGSPGEYYKDLSLVGVGKLNPNALTGKFSISVPKGIHELRQVYQSGYWLVNRGMIESRPSVNATEDLYLVINAELDADALDYVVHFTDQCNNPLPFTELTVRLERRIDLSNFGISARMLYNPQNNPFMVADENGTAHFPLNPGIGRLDVMASYADGANNAPGGGFNEETLLISGDRTATVKITLDECLASGDTIAPQVQGSVFDASSPAGWYNQPVAINWEATDPEPSSGAATQPPPTFADQEGVHQYTSGESCDPEGNCATGTYEVKLDTVRPTFQFKRKHIRQLLHGVFSGRVTDATSGIESVVITNGKRTLSSLNGDITLTCSEDGLKCDWSIQIRKLQHLNGKNTQLIVTDKAGNQRIL